MTNKIKLLSILIALTPHVLSIAQDKQVSLFDGALISKVGDQVNIGVPTGRQPNRLVYKFISTNNISKGTSSSPASDLQDYKGRITGFESLANGSIQAIVKLNNSDKEVYIMLPQALTENEIQMSGSPFIDRSNLFNLYLKTQPTVSDELAELYLNNFGGSTSSMNEFQKNRIIASTKGMLDSIRVTNIKTGSFKLYKVLDAGEYDFKTKSFPAKNTEKRISYELELPQNLSFFAILLSNISETLNIPVSEDKAEELVTKHFANKPLRQFHCIYSFNLIGNLKRPSVNDPENYMLPGNMRTLTANARVSTIEVFLDASLSNKIATIEISVGATSNK